MIVSHAPIGVVSLPQQRVESSPPIALDTNPPAGGTAPAAAPIAAAAPVPAPVTAAAPSAKWVPGQVHPLFLQPPAALINASLGGLVDIVKNTFTKLRYKPEELQARQVQAAIEMMRADQAAAAAHGDAAQAAAAVQA